MDENVLYYLAGIFDGEGSVYITKQRNSYTLGVGVDMVNQVIPMLFRALFKGTLQHYPAKGERKEHYKWIAQANQALNFLKEIEPYSLIKGEQIELGIKFQERKGGRGYTISDTGKELELMDKARMSGLNLKKGTNKEKVNEG